MMGELDNSLRSSSRNRMAGCRGLWTWHSDQMVIFSWLEGTAAGANMTAAQVHSLIGSRFNRVALEQFAGTMARCLSQAMPSTTCSGSIFTPVLSVRCLNRLLIRLLDLISALMAAFTLLAFPITMLSDLISMRAGPWAPLPATC